MRQMSDEGRREIAKELREQFNCCQYAEEFTEGLYDVLDHRISASDEDAGPTRRPVAVDLQPHSLPARG